MISRPIAGPTGRGKQPQQQTEKGTKERNTPSDLLHRNLFFLTPIAKGETRAGERVVSPFEKREMLSGAGPCELRSLPARCLWRLDALFVRSSAAVKSESS